MTNKTADVQIHSTVPMPPSADLVIYRFDQLDTALGRLDAKVEKMSLAYVNRDEMMEIQREISELKSTDDRQQGSIDANRRFVSIGLAVLSILVVGLTTYLGLHHR